MSPASAHTAPPVTGVRSWPWPVVVWPSSHSLPSVGWLKCSAVVNPPQRDAQRVSRRGARARGAERREQVEGELVEPQEAAHRRRRHAEARGKQRREHVHHVREEDLLAVGVEPQHVGGR
eukprot:CAMPEP_0205894742 /NCGR_PEP_ID=MMETSP1083-20121108/24005_1 /ASSEMBLY_ACC=CAM_ASM_000430 /TAXON_ID=97485 /ORGANISM="Prymnesium parvum, Strain Texoma1" /LENGTH=119 /DNA_ID=CAMNT_0053259613 /DNA_START=180 /DNA_END=537 /DNA_ORIENTATION=+